MIIFGNIFCEKSARLLFAKNRSPLYRISRLLYSTLSTTFGHICWSLLVIFYWFYYFLRGLIKQNFENQNFKTIFTVFSSFSWCKVFAKIPKIYYFYLIHLLV